MRTLLTTLFAIVAINLTLADSIDSRVVQIMMPFEDVSLSYVEANPTFKVKLETKKTSIEAQSLFVGDGTVAIELVAHPTNGIFLQGEKIKNQLWKTESTIKVKQGFKKASELKKGDVYVILPGVQFDTGK